MLPDVKQMYSFMKAKGFRHSKDALGIYFDKNNHKISINKQANWYTCYHNILQENSWILLSKSQIFSNFQEALYWATKEIEKTNSY